MPYKLYTSPILHQVKPWPGKLVKIRHCPRNGKNEKHIFINQKIYTTACICGKVDMHAVCAAAFESGYLLAAP